MKFKVGDEVFVVGRGYNGAARELAVRVASVGRKWVKVDGPRFSHARFSADDGVQDGKGYTPDYRLMSPDERAAELAEIAARGRLRSFGITVADTAKVTAVQLLAAIRHLVEPT